MNITAIYSVVQVICGQPALTNYVKKEDAEAAFKKMVEEQFIDNLEHYQNEIDEAIKEKLLEMDDYSVALLETDLVG